MKRNKWLVWGALLPSYFFAFFHRTAISTIGETLRASFGFADGAGVLLGSLAGIYFAAYGTMQIPSGIVNDAFGPRIVSCVSALILGIATIMFSFAQTMAFALIARFCVGFGSAFIFLSLLKLQTTWFDVSQFPLLTGLSAFVGSLGALAGLYPFAALIQILDWRTCFQIFGALTILSAVAIIIITRDTPEKDALRAKDAKRYHLGKALLAILKNRDNYLILIVFACALGGYMSVAGLWGSSYLAHTYGLTKTSTAAILTLMSLGLAVGSALNGAIVTLFGSVKRAAIGMLSVTAVCWLLLAITTYPRAIWFVCVLYFAIGFFGSGYTFAFSTTRLNNDASISATAISFTNAAGFLSIALVQPFCGWILDRFVRVTETGEQSYVFEGYRLVFLFVFALFVVATALYCFIREPKTTK